ncbi:unnamed protein product [Paramecium primaurelia]|uniref:Uncharacterized protein n=2 Tax=Paramecium TaxID=5884 RepID=A0A8S1VT11_9CILI|nr:unnamed protein product [Paramecium primaurelia]CAD8179897.1 unnamed protein product [Paramecium pentaurelia]
MKQILAIALLILCITARKHHKQEGEEPTNPMVQCIQDNCMNEAFGCVFDDACAETMKTCDEEHGEDMKIDTLVECTANNEFASAFATCMQTNCASLEQVMRFFNRRK